MSALLRTSALFTCLPSDLRLPHPSTSSLAIIALVAANAMWGASAAASKALLPQIPPLTMATARVAIALLVLLLIARLTGVQAATGRAPALLGFSGVAVFCACQNVGLRYADAATTSLINGAIPVLTAILAVPLLGERLSGRRLAGLLVAMAGVAVVVAMGNGAATGLAALGNVLPLVGSLGFAAYVVIGRRYFGGANGLALVAGSTRYGLFMLLPLSGWELAGPEPGVLSMHDWLLLLYLGVGCSALAFLLCGYGLAHLEASRGAAAGYLKPLVGVILSVAVLREPFALPTVAGSALILAGVWLGTVNGPRSIRATPSV